MREKTYKTSIGGQALIEGIMMKGPSKTSVAVRTPDGNIDIKTEKNGQKFKTIKKIPFVRGVFNMIASFVDGYKYLTYSAEKAGLEEEEEPSKFEKWLTKVCGENLMKIIIVIGSVLGVLLSLFLFMFIPSFITSLLAKVIGEGYTDFLKTLTEGIIKIVIFLIYMASVSYMQDIRRVFMYHGAEHKSIHCYESGLELTVENVKTCSRFHKRCGTSFVFLVLLISILLFSVLRIPWGNVLFRVLIKVLCLPLIAGIAYEVIKLAGRYDNIFTDIISAPGLWLQRLTTKEPDDSMMEVAIAALKEVLPEKGENDKW